MFILRVCPREWTHEVYDYYPFHAVTKSPSNISAATGKHACRASVLRTERYLVGETTIIPYLY